MKNKKRVGRIRARIPERWLLLVFFAFAGGAAIFFFFLSSRDMRAAQSRVDWSRQVEVVLEKLSLELGNSALIEHPFEGPSNQVLYRKTIPSGGMEPSIETEFLLFSDKCLYHGVKSATGTNILKPFFGFANPILSNIQQGEFTTLSPRLLSVIMKISPPDSSNIIKQFEKMVFLKNQ